MNQLTAEGCKRILEEAKKNVQDLNLKVLDILKSGKKVHISNQDYMKCYDIVIKASDATVSQISGSGSHPIQTNEVALFQLFNKLITEYLKNDLDQLETIQDAEAYVTAVYNQYHSYQIYLYWQARMFYYLNNFYLKNISSTLVNEGFKLYRDRYFALISDKLFGQILYFQKLARGEQVIPRDIIKKLIHIYIEVGFKKNAELKKDPSSNQFNYSYEVGMKFYDDHFQCKFAIEIEQYYHQKLNEWSSLSVPDYVDNALKSLQLEEQIAEIYYPKSSKIIINRIEQIIIMQSSETLVNNELSGLYRMLTEKKDKEIKNLFTLFNRVKETLDQIAKKFNQYLIFHGNECNSISDSKKAENTPQKDIAIEYIQKVSQLKKESDHMMSNLFGSDITIEKSRDNAFQQFLNRNEKSTFFLATYADNILRQENLQNEQEMEQYMQEIVSVFQFFYSRDTFFKHYQKYFSNRLLNSTSKNKEAEKALIAKFKAEAGQTGVNKIETMLKDIANSEQFINENKESLQRNNQIELCVNVLTTGSWPIVNTTDRCSPPQVLKQVVSTFENLYKLKYRGRNINWLFSQGTAEMSFKAKERYGLVVNSYQMVALLMIQSQGSKIEYNKLLETSGIPDSELGFILMPLIKIKVLNKSDTGDDMTEATVLSVNAEFTNKLKRIRCIPGGNKGQQKKQKDDEEGKQQFMEEMTKEREFIIDACVVRVMKSRKQMKHNELFQEVLKLIHNFKPEISVIKRRIESLIEREYIKRDETDRNLFIYVP